MPPKIRRPAAAPKARVRGVRLRPAARGVVPPAEKTLEEKYNSGDPVVLSEVPLHLWRRGDLLIFDQGYYYGKVAKAAGRFRQIDFEGADTHVEVIVSGTGDEELLRHATGSTSKLLKVHACPDLCGKVPHGPLILHSREVRHVAREGEKDLTWELNLEGGEERGDDLEELRKRQEEHARDKKEDRERSSPEGEKRKRRKKKRKKRPEDSSVESKEGNTGLKNRKYGGLQVAKKGLKEVFRGTGLDPSGKTRLKVAAFARRKMRKVKLRDKDTDSESSSDSEVSSLQPDDFMVDDNKVKQLARFGPGLLTSNAVTQMRSALVDMEGSWGTEGEEVPPVMLRYTRATMANRLSGGVLKEGITVAAAIDLLLQGRVAEAGDLLTQRLKALEQNSQGIPWGVTEKMELMPPLQPAIRSRGEALEAQREYRLDLKSKAQVGSYPGKSWGGGKGKQKSKQEDKGKGKKKGGDQSGSHTKAAQ